jgi:metallo-beta-lactamase family protein
MHLELFGATNGVTGSCHRLHVGDADIVLDCGLYQGRRRESTELNRNVPSWVLDAHAMVLSHAHIDHSGNIPTAVARGFHGDIYCTPATRDLCSVMLRDAAMIQEQDAAYLNKRYAREGSEERVDPLYSLDDVAKAIGLMVGVPLHRRTTIAPGVVLELFDSGHVLGSALVVLDCTEHGRKTRLLFTGDLGRSEVPLLRDPELVGGVDVLMTESTYGDRVHPTFASMDAELGAIIERTIARGGKVFIPSFALERAQEILVAIKRLKRTRDVPDVPIYIDSPLAVAITEIYKLHPDSLDPLIQKALIAGDSPFELPKLHYITDIAASTALQERAEPCVIIAGSGMCEGGRILHHLAKGLSNSKNSVVIVGYQAQHTLGRRLAEHRREVKVWGLPRDVYCEVYTLSGFSAHADRNDLLELAKKTQARGKVKAIVLVHGDDQPKAELKAALEKENVCNTILIAEKGQRLDL